MPNNEKDKSEYITDVAAALGVSRSDVADLEEVSLSTLKMLAVELRRDEPKGNSADYPALTAGDRADQLADETEDDHWTNHVGLTPAQKRQVADRLQRQEEIAAMDSEEQVTLLANTASDYGLDAALAIDGVDDDVKEMFVQEWEPARREAFIETLVDRGAFDREDLEDTPLAVLENLAAEGGCGGSSGANRAGQVGAAAHPSTNTEAGTEGYPAPTASNRAEELGGED